MMKSNAFRVRALWRVVSLHPKAWAASFLIAVALVVLATVFWPGGAPQAVPIVGSAMAVAIGLLVPWLLAKRQPYLRTAEDVESALGLRVLATYTPSLREDW